MAIGGVAVLGYVLLSSVDSDNPTHTFDVTDKAVEDGQSIGDHMKEQPPTLSISGTLLGDDAWTKLARIRQYQHNRELITYTNRTVYSNMAVTSVSTVHDGSVANGLKFNITLRRVRRAALQTVQLTSVPRAVATKAQPQQNAGTQQPRQTAKQSNNKDSDIRLNFISLNYVGGGQGGRSAISGDAVFGPQLLPDLIR